MPCVQRAAALDSVQQIFDPGFHRRADPQKDVRLFDPRPLAFRCSCSHARVAAMLRMLGYDEVRAILAERGLVEVGCEFCGASYRFDRWEAERVFTASAGQQ